MPSAPPRAAFADHDADDRRGQPRHLEHRVGDHLGLAALLGADARIGARRVDQADDRHVELGGQLHLGHGLAIALGMGAAEVAGVAFLERLCLFDGRRPSPCTRRAWPSRCGSPGRRRRTCRRAARRTRRRPVRGSRWSWAARDGGRPRPSPRASAGCRSASSGRSTRGAGGGSRCGPRAFAARRPPVSPAGPPTRRSDAQTISDGGFQPWGA